MYDTPRERPLGQLRFGGCGVGAKRGLEGGTIGVPNSAPRGKLQSATMHTHSKKARFHSGHIGSPTVGKFGGTRVVGGARSTSAAFELGEQVRRVAPDQVSRDELRTDAPTRIWENPLILYLKIRFFRCDYRAVKCTRSALVRRPARIVFGVSFVFSGQPFPATSSNEFSSSPVPHVPIHMLPELTSSVLPSYIHTTSICLSVI